MIIKNKNQILNVLSDNKKIIYVHIPFCNKKCIFCSYFSVQSKNDSIKKEYLGFLLKEFIKYKPIFEKIKEHIIAIHIGGGSPSDLTYGQLKFLFNMIKDTLDFRYIKQYSIEINPNIVGLPNYLEKLRLFKKYGITRISFGVQTFNEKLYEINNMSQKKSDIFSLIRDIKKFNFESYGFDLMINIKRQTINDFCFSIVELLNIFPPHFAIFNQVATRSWNKRSMSNADTITCQKIGDLIPYKLGYLRMAANSAFDWTHFCFIEGGKFILDYDTIGLGVSSHSIFKHQNILLVNPRSFKTYYNYINKKEFFFEKEIKYFTQKNIHFHHRVHKRTAAKIIPYNETREEIHNDKTNYLITIADGIRYELNKNFKEAEKLYHESKKYLDHYFTDFCLLSLKTKNNKKIHSNEISGIDNYPTLAKSRILYILGRYYYQRKKINIAFELLQRSIRFNANDLNTLSLLSLIYKNIDLKRSKKYFTKVKKLAFCCFKNYDEFVYLCERIANNKKNLFFTDYFFPATAWGPDRL